MSASCLTASRFRCSHVEDVPEDNPESRPHQGRDVREAIQDIQNLEHLVGGFNAVDKGGRNLDT